MFLTTTLLVAAPAAAQTVSTNDASVGYSSLRLFDNGFSLNIPIGWNASVGGGINDIISGIADFGGHYKREEGETLAIHSFQGGIRAGARRPTRVVPFGQVTFGGSVWSGGADTEWVWVVQPGAGVDVLSRDGGPGLRLQVDIPIYFDNGDSVKGVRFTVGAVFPVR